MKKVLLLSMGLIAIGAPWGASAKPTMSPDYIYICTPYEPSQPPKKTHHHPKHTHHTEKALTQ